MAGGSAGSGGRWRRMLKGGGLAVLWLASVPLANGPASGGEVQVTREVVVAAVEREPGPTKGRDDAPITIVEFSDFQCPFCRKFALETLPKLEAEYIDTGKVRFVYRHLIGLGAPSAQAAHGAECAREQGKFWPYHDLLFEQTGALAFMKGRLKGYARELGLDEKAFDACMASGRHQDRIRQETEVARYLGATGTPAFLINGQLLIGARPFETFKRALNAMLDAAEGKAPSIRIAPGPATAPAKK